MSDKKRLWHKAKSGVDVDSYKEVEKKVRNMIRHAKKKYEKKLSEGGNNGKARRKFFASSRGRPKLAQLSGLSGPRMGKLLTRTRTWPES